MRKRKTETAEYLLCCMVFLLGLMVVCLLALRRDVKALEQEIQTVVASETVEKAEICANNRAKTAAVAPVPRLTDAGEQIAADLVTLAAENTTPAPERDSGTDYVLRVLTAEAGTDEVLCGCVAQALYNACERYGWAYSPAEMMVKYRYTDPASWVSAEAEKAWDEVFMSGVTWDCVGKATVFYAPRYGESAYHESQRFVVEINGVRFFEEVQG